MGLDMYAYAAQKGQHEQFWEDYDFKTETSSVPRPREIAYWRKHPNLHGWMHKLWISKGNMGEFNGDELELTLEDLDLLETDVERNRLPATQGFFFGNDADQHYKVQDLQFIQDARAAILQGERVCYNSSW